jgi:hypothetical protein
MLRTRCEACQTGIFPLEHLLTSAPFADRPPDRNQHNQTSITDTEWGNDG